MPLLLASLMVILGIALYAARTIVLSSLIGIGMGVLLVPPVSFLNKKLRIPPGLSAAAMALLLIGSILGFVYLLSSLVINQLVPIIEQIPSSLERLRSQAMDLLPLESAKIGDVLKKSVGTALQGVQLTALALGMLVFIMALAGYVSVTPERYLTGLLSAFSPKARDRLSLAFKEAASQLRRWFLAQIVSMVFVGVVTSLGLKLIGVDHWLLVGFLAACCEFIPYLGPILGALLGVAVTLGSEPDRLLWVLGLFLVIQQLEGNVITPLVLKKGVELPPVHLLIFALLMGSWFGFIGVFIAAPVLTVGRTLYLRTAVPQLGAEPIPAAPVRRVPRAAANASETIPKKM